MHFFSLAWFAGAFCSFPSRAINCRAICCRCFRLWPRCWALRWLRHARASFKVACAAGGCAALLWFIPAILIVLPPSACSAGVSHAHFRFPLAWIAPAVLAFVFCRYLEKLARRTSAVALIALVMTCICRTLSGRSTRSSTEWFPPEPSGFQEINHLSSDARPLPALRAELLRRPRSSGL